MKKLKTYSEANKRKPFDWNKALKENCKNMSLKKAIRLMKKSETWTTCACGNQCNIIPRNAYGVPMDDRLTTLGRTFMYNIGDMQSHVFCRDHKNANLLRKRAIKVLHKIENRSSVLVKRILKNSKKKK